MLEFNIKVKQRAGSTFLAPKRLDLPSQILRHSPSVDEILDQLWSSLCKANSSNDLRRGADPFVNEDLPDPADFSTLSQLHLFRRCSKSLLRGNIAKLDKYLT